MNDTGRLDLPKSDKFQEPYVLVNFRYGALMSIFRIPPSNELSKQDADTLSDTLQRAVAEWRASLKLEEKKDE